MGWFRVNLTNPCPHHINPEPLKEHQSLYSTVSKKHGHSAALGNWDTLVGRSNQGDNCHTPKALDIEGSSRMNKLDLFTDVVNLLLCSVYTFFSKTQTH